MRAEGMASLHVDFMRSAQGTYNGQDFNPNTNEFNNIFQCKSENGLFLVSSFVFLEWPYPMIV
jgi:hypothetical protein